MKTIQVRRTRHAGHCWRSRDELISDVLLWIPTYGRAKAGQPARTYIQQLGEDTECSPEDLPEAMNDREKWRGRVRDIHACGMTWWWYMWHYVGHSCAGVCVHWYGNLFVLAQNPHKGPEGEISYKTGSGGGKEGPREVKREQLTKEGRRELSAWDNSPEKEAVRRWKQGREVSQQKSERWLLRPVDLQRPS